MDAGGKVCSGVIPASDGCRVERHRATRAVAAAACETVLGCRRLRRRGPLQPHFAGLLRGLDPYVDPDWALTVGAAA